MTSSTNFPGPVKVQGRDVATFLRNEDGSVRALVDGGGKGTLGTDDGLLALAVQNLRLCAKSGGLLVYWDRPTTGPADSYSLSVSPGGQTSSTTSTSANITGLTNGVAYTVTVTPVTAGGTGTASSATATPTAGPVAVDGLALWYDANQESYSNGASVTALTDRSGNGKHSLGVSTSNPLFVSSWTNSKPAVAFTSAGSKFLKTGIKVSDVPGPVTVFWVGQLDSVSGNKRILNWRSAAALGVRQGLMIDHNATTLRAYSSEISHQDITVSASTPYIISDVCGASTIYLNGTASSSVTKSSAPPLNPGVDQYLYFNSDYGTATYGDQKCGELLVYNRALTQAERWVVEAYLAAKYNITVVQA